MQKKTTLGLIVGTRGFFNVELSRRGREQLIRQVAKLGYDHVILPASATPTGAVETVEDASKCARLFQDKRDAIDGIVVSLPNFGDELGVINAIREAALNVPVLVQASDDELDKVDVDHRRDSFCGKLSVCNNLYQYDIPFTDTTTHTCALEGRAFADDLRLFADVCRVVRGLRRARIGAIGARPGAFQTMRVSEKLLQKYGITVVPVDLSEIIFAAQRLDDGAREVKAKIEAVKAYGRVVKGTPPAQVAKAARLCVAIEGWVRANNIQAAGVQCWTSIQQNYGCAACLAMSMLGETLVPMACEVDVNGVISMYALTLATGQPSALLDWNNNYGDDRDKCVNTHCSSYPRGFIGGPVEIGALDILGNSLGAENCFGAVKGKVRKGPMTFFRISSDDTRGKMRAYLGEGQFTDDPFAMAGGIAVCQVPNLQKLLKHLCKFGYEHHVGMVRGHCAAAIREAVETYFGWDLYAHE
jgi:L-fucose isomerase-like protein